MRLISQNILCCRVNKCFGNNKSLNLFVEESKVVEKEFSKPMVLKMFSWMEWGVLRKVALQVPLGP